MTTVSLSDYLLVRYSWRSPNTLSLMVLLRKGQKNTALTKTVALACNMIYFYFSIRGGPGRMISLFLVLPDQCPILHQPSSSTEESNTWPLGLVPCVEPSHPTCGASRRAGNMGAR